MKILVIYPADSTPTIPTFNGGVYISKMLKSKGHKVDDLAGITATRFPFSIFLKWNKYDMIVYLGHGGSDRLFGQLPFGLIQALMTLSDAYSFRDQVIVTIACLSGKRLGKLIRAKAYYGSEYYMMVAFPEVDHNYMLDFIETWSTIPLHLAENGDDFLGAYREYQKRCTYYIEQYKKNKWTNWDTYAYALKINRDYYRVFL